jgi:hypothetical protein
VAIGAACGFLFKAVYSASTSSAPSPTTNYGWTPVIAGVMICAFLAVCAILYSLNSGAGMVLRVSGAAPADPAQYPQPNNVVGALAIGDGIPKPAVYVIRLPAQRPGMTLITVTHDMRVADTADRIIWLRDGRVDPARGHRIQVRP